MEQWIGSVHSKMAWRTHFFLNWRFSRFGKELFIYTYIYTHTTVHKFGNSKCFVSFFRKKLRGGGGTTLFHVFRAVYTVKELDSHAKHGQRFKKLFWQSISVSEMKVSESYFDRGSCWCKRRWNSLYGHFSWKIALVHASTRARASASFINTLHPDALLHGTRSGRMSLKKCDLLQLLKEYSVTWTVDAVCFSGAAMEFLKCVCWWTFYKQGPVRRWISSQ